MATYCCKTHDKAFKRNKSSGLRFDSLHILTHYFCPLNAALAIYGEFGVIISEKEIDFSKLTPNDFEELCFDLILNGQYENVLWREGSFDDGRDIEAIQRVVNPLTDNYNGVLRPSPRHRH